jgi:histidinol-phosphate aminotransferase
MSIILAREPIKHLVPYSSARLESLQQGIHLDANKNPYLRDDALNRYPYPQPRHLRQSLADLYGMCSSQLLMTRGSDEGIDLLTRVFCEANKDAIMITPPTYAMYEVAANIKVPLESANFALNKDTLLDQLDARVKLLFLCSPNNPTGTILDTAVLIDICEALKNKVIVVLDEAYIEFSTAQSMSAFVSQYPNLVVLRTLSKAYGLAGARLGSLIANQAIINLLHKVIAPYPIPVPVERTVTKALIPKNLALVKAQIKSLCKAREEMYTFLCTLSSVDCVYPSQANFILVRVNDALQWMASCKAQQIIIRSRAQMSGLENCVRITIGTTAENKRLKEVLTDV